MTNKEFQKMIDLFIKLNKLLKKYDEHLYPEDLTEDKPTPIMIPDDVYDEICKRLKTKEIGLLGIS